MNISNINFLKFASNQNTTKYAPKFNSGLKQDIFEKSNDISFTGKPFKGTPKVERRIPKAPKNIGYLSGIYNLTTMLSRIMGLSSYVEECEAEGYVNLFTNNKQTRSRLKSSLNERLETFNQNYIYAATGSISSITNTITNTGINTCAKMEGFLRQYNDTPGTKKIFAGQVIEAMSIFTLLENKQHLSKYGELALYLYNQEAEKEEPDFDKINRYTKFLDEIGAKDTKGFEEKYAHLKADFNDFEDTSDKIDAIEYLIETYDDKIKFLAPYTQGKDPKKVYPEIAGVIDTLYKKNDGKSLGKEEKIIQTAAYGGRLKSNSEKMIAPLFNEFKTPEDFIDFYGLISEFGADIKDLNQLLAKGIITDIDPLDNLLNFEEYTNLIQNIKGVTKEEANKIYFDFKDPINALLNKEDDKLEILSTFFDTMQRLDIKNSNTLLDLYNRAYDTKQKGLVCEDLKEFIGIINLADSRKEIEYDKAKKILSINNLKAKKEKIDAIKAEIKEYVDNDTAGFFTGLSINEIYLSYKNLLQEGSVKETLANASALGVQTSDEYKEKAEKIQKFAEFFNSKDSVLKFVNNAKFKFNNSQSDNAYQKACYDVLTYVSANGDNKDIQRRVDFYSNSKFFQNSRYDLEKFIEKTPAGKRSRLFAKIADMKIQNISDINKFLKQYKDKEDKTDNLYEFLINLPENIKFDDILSTLSYLNDTLGDINVAEKIDNSNILNIGSDALLKKRKLNTEGINRLANEVLDAKDTNVLFVSNLKGAYKEENKGYSTFRIAREIANKAGETEESYQNLVGALKIDKNSLEVDENASDYIYTRAIEEALTPEFIEFVNSNEWLDFNDDKTKIPDFSLHAKLRMIDRYALANGKSEDVLYTNDTKENLKNIAKSIYTKAPNEIKKHDKKGAIVIDTNCLGKETEVVFSNDGKVITIVPVKK